MTYETEEGNKGILYLSRFYSVIALHSQQAKYIIASLLNCMHSSSLPRNGGVYFKLPKSEVIIGCGLQICHTFSTSVAFSSDTPQSIKRQNQDPKEHDEKNIYPVVD